MQQRRVVGVDLDAEIGQEGPASRSRSSHSSSAIRSRCSRSAGSIRLASTSWAASAGHRSTRSVMVLETAGAA
jgi:hypothetical protein